MAKPRRVEASRTPYDRPGLEAPEESGSPGWLAGFIVPATRKIASGAGKIISTVFSADGSSSSEEEGGDSDSSSDGVEDGSSQGTGWMNKKDWRSSPVISFNDKSQPVAAKTETKRIIEQLLMQETFTREECDKLVDIIRLRVLEDGATTNGDMPDIYSPAIMEAKKWLEEKKLESSSNLEYNAENTVMPQRVIESDMGSPADMARSYMRSRSPWSSSSLGVRFHTPSPTKTTKNCLKEEASNTIGCNLLSTSKLKRGSLASDSWNLQEELRRVRSRATEDMLKSVSAKPDFPSSFDVDQKISENKLEADACLKMSNNLNPLTAKKSTDASSNSVMEVNDFHDVTTTGPDMEAAQDVLQNGALSSTPAPVPAVSVPDDSISNDKECCSSPREIAAVRGTQAANGFPPSPAAASSFVEKHVQSNSAPSNDEQAVVSSHEKANTDPTGGEEETCEFLSEVSLEIPHDPVVQNSEETKTAETSPGNKRSRYYRKTRGKGK